MFPQSHREQYQRSHNREIICYGAADERVCHVEIGRTFLPEITQSLSRDQVQSFVSCSIVDTTEQYLLVVDDLHGIIHAE